MTDRPDESPWLKLLGGLLVSASLAFAPASFAQEESDDETEEEEVEETEEIVVTGSRIKRSTYSSVSPLQIISGQVSRNIGAIDPSTILQDSPAAAGQQIDTTFQGFVLDNGPGASTIDLRGLGAARTLVLINGRRAAPAGVEGAPFAPDLNIIPSSLVQQYEILLDGASSVYGSDALSGVANVILRKDFDGLEVEAYSRIPDYSNGVTNTLSAAWGANFDRGFFGIAAEFTDAEPVRREDRPWSDGCETYREEGTDGNIYTTNILYQELYGMKATECVIAFGAQRAFGNNGLFGSIYWTPGSTNTTIPNLSEATLFDVVLDLDGNGAPDVDFTDYFITNEDTASFLLPDNQALSFMTYGEYTLDGEMNITPYYEVTYNKRETFAFSAGASIFEEVPANNPFNPCNPNAIAGRGVDCGEAYNSVLANPNYVADFGVRYEALCGSFGFTIDQCTPGLFGLFLPGTGAVGALPLESQVSIRGDRSTVETEVDQLRIVAGIRGDLPQIDFGSFTNWSFDVAVVASESTGKSKRTGVNEERLLFSLNNSFIDGNGVVQCNDGNGNTCVPVDMFSPTLFENIIDNELGSQAERDYLFSDRLFDTDYNQTYITAIATGDILDLPAGPMSAAFGYEYRNDEIDSIPNDVARDGLLWGFFRDLGAVGEKDTEEYFVEVEVPILANMNAAKELNVNISTRHTKDEFYGGAWTYSGKLAWRPVDNLLVRGTVGTSYRAPNLRENFLLGQSGFLTLSDPCVVPADALELAIGGGVTYDPTGDTREQVVIDNCIAQGIDPTTLGVLASGATTPRYSVEILRGVGSTTLREEQSDSWTAGFSLDMELQKQINFLEDMDIQLGATYYEIDIRDEIIQQGAQGSINACYNDSELDSVFCSNISRENGGTGLIDEVDQAFLNRDSLQTRGVDLNMAIDWPVEMFDRPVDLSADFNFNRKLQFSDAITDIVTGNVERDSDLGQFGLPEWEGSMIFRADVSDYRFTWNVRYLGSVRIDPDTRAALPFVDIDTGSRTCVGAANGGVDCRPVGEADNYFRSDMSVYYYGDVWTIGAGARNVFDEAPPLVDGRAQFSAFNTPFGAGYDINGRQFFINVAAAFDNLTF